jgi:hypothetical protein
MEKGESWFKSSLNKKIRRPFLIKQVGRVVHTYNLWYAEVVEGLQSKSSPGQK